VRRVYEKFNRGDWLGAAELVDPGVEWEFELEGMAGPDAPRVARGKHAIRDFWAHFFAAWDEWKMSPGGFTEGTEGRVVVPVHFTARGRGSGVPIDVNYFQVFAVRSEKIVRVVNYRDETRALKAAGLSE
jgi:ketosteroid isomerase-like protein